eukprot:CAMPEP_0197073726 /NCGR_PEP_ID=MMETSP1384-20130603/210751_1 /TAXON_ID=29189 /ORGANISM="Ammonia sp." /LENGTH=536 /DNA_ID=CAMNT_0042512565 /DNA_START=88 /DNA_END=1698 /DNA_ORIENTATION=+
MLSLLLSLFATPLVLGAETERICYRGEARTSFMDGEFESFSAKGRQMTCPSAEYGCGAVSKSGTSAQLSDDDAEMSGYQARAWNTLELGCVPPALCEKVAGSTSGCRYADYSWIRFNPTNCNDTDTPAFGLERYRQTVRVYYECCDEDLCNTPERGAGSAESRQTESPRTTGSGSGAGSGSGSGSGNGSSTSSTSTTIDGGIDSNDTCEENANLGEYITALHGCWNERRLAYRKYFVCNEEGPELAEFRDLCSDSKYDEWDRNATEPKQLGSACYYRPTCSDELQQFIADFGECACDVAEDNGYTGELIGGLVESYWNQLGSACYYRPTCSDELQQFIADFGECACDVAEDNGYTGELIGGLVESYWNQFCPDLEISCAGTGNSSLLLRQRRRKRTIRFRVEKALSAINDAYKVQLRQKIATYLRRVDSEDEIVITVEESSDGRRRLLADESIINVDVYGNDAFDDSIETTACDASGLSTALDETVTIDSCDSTDDYLTVAGETEETTPTPTEADGASFSAIYFAVLLGGIMYVLQ